MSALPGDRAPVDAVDAPAQADETPEEMIARAHNALERLGANERYSAWMLVNCVIDPRDESFRFFAKEPLGRNPVREYLSDGWRTLSELLLLMDAVGKPLTTAGSVLEFAAGFGRFTRHLARAIPGRVTVSDIHPGSMEFQREQFGVDGFYSTHDPATLAIPGKYDLVFVLSMFTHLPPAMWAPWLRKLHGAVEPGGNLVFTVHDESLGAHLSGEYATRAWVEAEVERALGVRISHFREAAFWHGQAAVVVPGRRRRWWAPG